MTTDLLVRPATAFPALAAVDLRYPWPPAGTGLTAALPAAPAAATPPRA